MEKLIFLVTEIAKKEHGGHFSIYHFTTHVKGCYGTLEEFGDGKRSIRDQLGDMPPFNSLEELLSAMITNPKEMTSYYSQTSISTSK